jgi:hypothetical protein
MNQETHDSLVALEKELERLRAAVDHIDQAKGIAQKVLAATAGVQKKYADHLDALLGIQSATVEEMRDTAKTRFDDLESAAKRHILDAVARARKQFEDHELQVRQALDTAGTRASERITELTTRAEQVLQQSGDVLRKAADDSVATSGKSMTEHAQRVRELIEEVQSRSRSLFDETGRSISAQIQSNSNKTTSQIEEFAATARGQVLELGARAHKHIEELSTKANAGIEQIGALARSGVQDALFESKKALEDANAQTIRIFASIKKTYDQFSRDFEKLSVNTDSVIASAGKLVRTIDAIDFPEKLQAIQGDIRALHFNLNAAMSRIDALDKSMEHSLRELADDIVGKLSRIEGFVEKTVRTLSDDTERRFREQQEEIRKTRTLLVVVLLINIIIIAGLAMLWFTQQSDAEKTAPIPVVQDTLTVDTPPEETPAEAPRRRR